MSLKSRVADLAKAHHQSVSELERTLNFSNGSIGKWDKQNPAVDRVQQKCSILFLLAHALNHTTVAKSEHKK